MRELDQAKDAFVTPAEPAPVASAPAETVTRAAGAGRWPRRRRVVALLLTAAFASVGLGGAPGLTAAPTFTLLGVLAAALAALSLATYVPLPGTGRRLVVGCSPCAAAAGVAALASVGVLVSSPADGGAAALAVSLAGVAAAHRLTAPDACGVSG